MKPWHIVFSLIMTQHRNLPYLVQLKLAMSLYYATSQVFLNFSDIIKRSTEHVVKTKAAKWDLLFLNSRIFINFNEKRNPNNFLFFC